MPEFVCECGAKKGSEDALKSHICTKHLQWMPYECVHCSANQQNTREATEHKIRLHMNEIHPGKELKYTFHGDSHKEQQLKCKLEQTKNSVNDQNNPALSHQISIGSTEVAAKAEVITVDVEDDAKPQSPPVDHLSDHVETAADDQPTNEGTHSAHQAPTVVEETTGLMENRRETNSTVNQPWKSAEAEGENSQLIETDEQGETKPKPNYDSDDSGDDFEPSTPPSKSPIPEPEVKPELIVGDDDDFKPDPPASNMGDSQSQQHHVGGCSAEDAMGPGVGAGSSPQQPSISKGVKGKLNRKAKAKKGMVASTKEDRKTRKLNSRSSNNSGYCVTCKRQFVNIYRHLQAKLTSPVVECSKCKYGSNQIALIQRHITARVCGAGAKMVRIRSKMDVAGEMRKLRQTHLSVAPRKWPYRCSECKIGIVNVPYHVLKHHLKIERYECPVCGRSGDWEISEHIQKKHPLCNTRPINNEAKYRDQIRVILNQKGIIVRK